MHVCAYFCQGDIGPDGPTGPQGIKGEQGVKGEKVNIDKYCTLSLQFVMSAFCNLSDSLIKEYKMNSRHALYDDMAMACSDVRRAVLGSGFQDSGDRREKMARG